MSKWMVFKVGKAYKNRSDCILFWLKFNSFSYSNIALPIFIDYIWFRDRFKLARFL